MSDRTLVEQVENARLYSDGSVLVENVRLSYPHALVPQSGGVDKVTGKAIPPSYSATGLLDKKTHGQAMRLLKRLIDEILAEKKVSVKADFKFLRDGNASGKDDYLNQWTVSAREKETRPPSVRDVDGRTKLGKSDAEKLYGGCWGNILLKPWFQNNSLGKRVNANLIAIQIIPAKGRDNTALGEATRPSEDEIDETFDDYSSDADWETTAADPFEGL